MRLFHDAGRKIPLGEMDPSRISMHRLVRTAPEHICFTSTQHVFDIINKACHFRHWFVSSLRGVFIILISIASSILVDAFDISTSLL